MTYLINNYYFLNSNLVKSPDVDADVVRDAVLDVGVSGGHHVVGLVQVEHRPEESDSATKSVRTRIVVTTFAWSIVFRF